MFFLFHNRRLIVFFSLLCFMLMAPSLLGRGETKNLSKIEEKIRGESKKWEIKNGKFYDDGKWVFLKIAKPLGNFADALRVEQLIGTIDLLKSKNFNTIEINCYWHYFDRNGDGKIDVSLTPLNKLIQAIYDAGMYPCLSVETYSIGGGLIPAEFWKNHPDAYAIDANGKRIKDDEYGAETNNFAHIVSIFHKGYQDISRNFIKNLAKGINTNKILYFETTVEPQLLGIYNTCYSKSAKLEYSSWRAKNEVTDKNSEMPFSFPIPQSFIENDIWNKFRAESLANWVNGDAQAYREIAGKDSYVAVDYNDADPIKNLNRFGNPTEFLKHLNTANIIQLPGHWWNGPNKVAYERVRYANKQYHKNWAISEHMTFNGLYNDAYEEDMLRKVLINTLENGTRFGWEFVNIFNNSDDPFCMYHSDWEPKKAMRLVDDNWKEWLETVKEIENTK